jgi:hypothetical protein
MLNLACTLKKTFSMVIQLCNPSCSGGGGGKKGVETDLGGRPHRKRKRLSSNPKTEKKI